jgi:hypothetical protein
MKRKYSDFVERCMKFKKKRVFSDINSPSKNEGADINFDFAKKSAHKFAKYYGKALREKGLI